MDKFSVSSLGSGSKGNASLVAFADTLLMIDNGFSCKETEARMFARNIQAEQVTHILVTHEHSDHCKGVSAFANKYSLPVFMSYGTSLHKSAGSIEDLRIFDSHSAFNCGEIKVSPVVVPHDAREACQFIFQVNQKKIGLLTDLGSVTPLVYEQYSDCNILLLEFNHDYEKLLSGSYPAKLKARVSGDFGHLSNRQACEFLRKVSTDQLDYLVAMHISEQNNCAKVVEQEIKEVELNPLTQLILAKQNQGFDWLQV